MPTDHGGTSERYLYERLTEKRFQQLCNALLVDQFPDVTCFPVGQRDGGRDAVHKRNGQKEIIYQVKWAKDPIRKPVAWLNAAVAAEKANIKRLVTEGAQSYILMTCVAGTSAPGKGTMDKLDEALAAHSQELGIEMTCWWRADIDARVDNAPRELKWTYSEMLAGLDAVRYVIEADNIAAKDQELRQLLLKLIATQWHEDAKVKFRQVELDAQDLVDLFIDVEAIRVAAPRAAQGVWPARMDSSALGGAARYLLDAVQPLTLVRGEPGQGKSTLAQFLCQVHRAEFLAKDEYLPGARPDMTAGAPRVPLRVDLRDYALWLSGGDPYAEDPAPAVRRNRARPLPSLEAFLAHLLTARGGGGQTSVEVVNDVLSRFPMLIVLDGLDEVAHETTRGRVVKEINEFATRLGTGLTPPQLIVTTRPNASGLPEPSSAMFETIALVPLSASLRTTYLRKWADTRSLRGAARRALVATFRQRSIEPHIAQLADNPMQLTILLYLIQKRGDSVPAGRTELFTSYMETFLDREAEKSPSVHEHRVDLEEVTAYLGWHLQSLAETGNAAGQLPTQAIRKAINGYLFDVEKDTRLVGDLFTAVTDRVWALTSKVQGTFEFDIQTMREYFAARYLWEFAGADLRRFDKSTILRELVRRAYWLNTCRFFAGFANPNELSGLVDALEDELEAGARPAQVRVSAWTLITDGVFSGRVKAQNRAAAMFTDDLSLRLMTDALTTRNDVVALTHDRGADVLISALEQAVVATPSSVMNHERMRLAARLSGNRVGLDAWWMPRMLGAIATDTELAWLRIGTPFRAASRLAPDQLARLAIGSGAAAGVALDAGVNPPPDSALENRLVQAVLNGHCSDADITASGLAGDLARLLAPRHFLIKARGDQRPYAIDVGHCDAVDADHHRQAVLRRLKARDGRFGRVQAAMRFGKGQAGTTSPWGDTARNLAAIYGPCWLAAEIAIIGAASPYEQWRTGGTFTKGSQPFGPDTDYGRLLQDSRFEQWRIDWWTDQFDAWPDSLSRATWCLALLAVAAEPVVIACMDRLSSAVSSLSEDAVLALCLSSSRIGASGLRRRLGPAVLQRTVGHPLAGIVLVSHHVAALGNLDDLPSISDEQLAAMAAFGVAGWPGLRALTARMLACPSTMLLDAIRVHGPDAVVSVGQLPPTVPNELLRSILHDAADYPLAWLLAAERRLAQDFDGPHLARVAEVQRWFNGSS